MADDVKVTIGAVSSGATSEFKRVGQQLESLRQSGKKLGGVLEGDRRVEAKMTSWVQGFANARNGADLLANTLGNLGDVFKTSLAIGVGLNVGGALLSALSNAIAKAEELKKSADEAAASLRAAFSSGDQGQLSSAIANATANIEKLKASLTDRWFTGTTGEREEKNKLAELEKERSVAVGGLMEAKAIQLSINELKKAGMDAEAVQMQESARLAKEIADIEAQKLPVSERNAAVLMAQTESAARVKDAADARSKANEKEIAAIRASQSEADLKADAERNKRKLAFDSDIAKFVAEKNKQAADEEARDAERLAEQEREDAEYLADFEQKERDKALEDTKKLNDEKLKAAKKELDVANEKVKQAESAIMQGQRDAAGALGIYKGGASLPEQRASKAFYDRQADINAGVVARDEARRRFGGDADKLEEYRRSGGLKRDKDAILGKEKGGTVEDILTKALAEQKATATAVKALQEKLGIK